MSASHYIRELRAKIGHTTLLLPCVAAVILNEHNELLLQQKQDGSWSLPAGMIEPGESPKAAIIREVAEETGLAVDVGGLLGVFGGEGFTFTYANGDQVEYTVILIRCIVQGRSEAPMDDETFRLAYFDKKSLPMLALPYSLDVLFNEVSAAIVM
jgi:8-oxo-dGTP pyrophosphatase MutT (NUDIX family)